MECLCLLLSSDETHGALLCLLWRRLPSPSSASRALPPTPPCSPQLQSCDLSSFVRWWCYRGEHNDLQGILPTALSVMRSLQVLSLSHNCRRTPTSTASDIMATGNRSFALGVPASSSTSASTTASPPWASMPALSMPSTSLSSRSLSIAVSSSSSAFSTPLPMENLRSHSKPQTSSLKPSLTNSHHRHAPIPRRPPPRCTGGGG